MKFDKTNEYPTVVLNIVHSRTKALKKFKLLFKYFLVHTFTCILYVKRIIFKKKREKYYNIFPDILEMIPIKSFSMIKNSYKTN